jgi:hypothetical protein
MIPGRAIISVSAGARRFAFWLLCCVVAALAALALSPWTYDFGVFLFLVFFLTPAVMMSSLVLLVVAVFSKMNRRFCLSALAVLMTFVGTLLAADLGGRQREIRWSAMWLYRSRELKGKVLAQPEPPPGELRSFDWDGWGWAGQDTEAYLVFDPIDSLSVAARSGRPGKFPGIPCKVPQVYRLESHWYSVLYYTNEVWGYCDKWPE